MTSRPNRARRSCLSVPGSSPRMLDKAQNLPADQVLLDLEDSVAPLAKEDARQNVATALITGEFSARTRAVRINDWTTPWTYHDVIDVVTGAGRAIDCLILPKVHNAEHVAALDLLLTQVEKTCGLEPGAIGIEAQIESAHGVVNVEAIAAAASPRMEALVFGPADFMAAVGMQSLVVGEQPAGYEPGDAYHHVLMSILLAARSNGLQAIDGPHPQIHDLDGLRRQAARSAALGYDGKWVLHPAQIDVANETYRPTQDDYDRAELILDAYAWHTSAAGDRRGAVMLAEEMIDEASRRMALVVAAKGRAAGLHRTTAFDPPS